MPRMGKDGQIRVPKEVVLILLEGDSSLKGRIPEVMVAPVPAQDGSSLET